MTAKDLGPLTWNVQIVNKRGEPTPEFQRRWETQRSNNALIGSITLGTGAPPATPTPGDGAEYVDTSTSPYTLYVGKDGTWHQVSDVLNLIGSTQGDILYRNGTKWVVLPPGNAGEYLMTQGLSANPIWNGDAGFTISCTGPVPAGTLLGVGNWAKAITFTSGDAANSGVCLINPAASYSFQMLDAATLASIGQITISTLGVFTVTWTGSPLVWPANKPMLIYTQTIADGSLTSVNARIVGHF